VVGRHLVDGVDLQLSLSVAIWSIVAYGVTVGFASIGLPVYIHSIAFSLCNQKGLRSEPPGVRERVGVPLSYGGLVMSLIVAYGLLWLRAEGAFFWEGPALGWRSFLGLVLGGQCVFCRTCGLVLVSPVPTGTRDLAQGAHQAIGRSI